MFPISAYNVSLINKNIKILRTWYEERMKGEAIGLGENVLRWLIK